MDEHGDLRDADGWDGAGYQARVEEVLAGRDPHGEVAFVQRFAPASVLDAGCGTGRVAIELARRGVAVVGVDVSASMLDTARRLAPELSWVEADLATLELDRVFDVVVLAGNVPLFTPPGTSGALVAGCARHVAPGGVLVAGFQLDGRHGADDHDREARSAGLTPLERWSSWDRDPWDEHAGYVVSVHRRAADRLA